MDLGVELAGLSELDARLAHARAGLLDLTDVNREASRLALASSRAPRRTGALAAADRADVTRTGWGLVNGQPYAVPVFGGTPTMSARPWLLGAATGTEAAWTDLYATHVQQLLDHP